MKWQGSLEGSDQLKEELSQQRSQKDGAPLKKTPDVLGQTSGGAEQSGVVLREMEAVELRSHIRALWTAARLFLFLV